MSANQARREYYAFAHQALPELFFSDPQGLMKTLAEHGAGFLRYVWGQMEKYAQVENSGDAGKIEVEIQKQAKGRLALVTLPPPSHVTEAYFIAMLHRPGEKSEARYFTLEYGLDLDGKPYTVLCEWTADTIHHNLGPGPEPTKEQFLDRITQEFLAPGHERDSGKEPEKGASL